MRLLAIAAFVIVVDQVSKITVFQTMFRGQSISVVGDWLQITFTENPGMAFGITFGPPGMVTGFSIVATMLIVVYLYRIRGGYAPYRFSLALILGGAVGNIIDRMFYGLLFGYDELFRGRVVDFIHVNLWRGYIPDAIPLMGGNYMAFFPIWNVADMAIVVGVLGILIFQKNFHAQLMKQNEAEEGAAAALPLPAEIPMTPETPMTPSAPGEVPVAWVTPTAGSASEEKLGG